MRAAGVGAPPPAKTPRQRVIASLALDHSRTPTRLARRRFGNHRCHWVNRPSAPTTEATNAPRIVPGATPENLAVFWPIRCSSVTPPGRVAPGSFFPPGRGTGACHGRTRYWRRRRPLGRQVSGGRRDELDHGTRQSAGDDQGTRLPTATSAPRRWSPPAFESLGRTLTAAARRTRAYRGLRQPPLAFGLPD